MTTTTQPKPQSLKDTKKQRWIKIVLIIAFLIATFFIWYLTIPGLFIAWFLKTKRISKKAKIISSVTAGILFLILCVSMSIAYYKDPTPNLQIQEPTDNSTIKGHTVTIRGSYQPSDRKIWINDKEITVSGGQFEYAYNLNLGPNTITVSAGNWKRVKQALHVTRELTDEEVAQEKAEAERLAQEQAAKQAEEAQKAQQEVHKGPYSVLEVSDVSVDGTNVNISGTTDLPDGAKLATGFDVWGRLDTDSWIGSEGNAQVLKGEFTSTLPIPQRDEFAKGPYEVSVLFTPVGQTEQITNLVGKNGENLTGDLVSPVYGFKIVKLIVKNDLNISVSPIKYNFAFQLPSQYSQGTAEYTLAEFASAWKKQDWKGMTTWIAKDWISRQNDAAVALSAQLDFKHLEGFTITHVNNRSDVLATITFEAQYRLWAADSTNIKKVQISADIRKEDGNGSPSSNGTWGVYPIYSETEVE